jgi:hypothetical protein
MYFRTARRKDFKCFHHKEVINVSVDRQVYPDLNIIHCIYVFKYCMVPINIYNFYVSIKNIKKAVVVTQRKSAWGSMYNPPGSIHSTKKKTKNKTIQNNK